MQRACTTFIMIPSKKWLEKGARYKPILQGPTEQTRSKRSQLTLTPSLQKKNEFSSPSSILHYLKRRGMKTTRAEPRIISYR